MSIIREFAYGNINCLERKLGHASNAIMERMDMVENKLRDGFNKDQNANLDKFIELFCEYLAEECFCEFERAFSIGLSFGYESHKISRE